MTLEDVILNCQEYGEDEDLIYLVFARREDNQFKSSSEAVVLGLSEEEAELRIEELSNLKCPGLDYFLELFILKEFYEDIEYSKDYKSDKSKVERIIHYAEFDA